MPSSRYYSEMKEFRKEKRNIAKVTTTNDNNEVIEITRPDLIAITLPTRTKKSTQTTEPTQLHYMNSWEKALKPLANFPVTMQR